MSLINFLKPSAPTRQKLSWLVLGLFLGSLGFYAFQGLYLKTPDSPTGKYPLVREGQASTQKIHYSLEKDSRLQKDLSSYIYSSNTPVSVQNVSVYFIDLAKGNWAGINENTGYSPASLLKVAIMIAYFKQAEDNPGILQKKIVYTPNGEDIAYEDPSKLTPKQSYTIEELIERMITDSDNGAAVILSNNISPEMLSTVYGDLGIQAPDQATVYTISAKTYSQFFRILYNDSYLNSEMSEKALELLSRTTYNDGLVKNLPQGITISHKYGEHVEKDQKGQLEIELHDCGIIYAQSKPSLLCIMTQGKNINDLSQTIQSISKTVFDKYINAD